MELVQIELEKLAKKFSDQVNNYIVTNANEVQFENFIKDYKSYDRFFDNISATETDVLKIFKKNSRLNDDDGFFFKEHDLKNFLAGNIIVKEICDKGTAENLKAKINNILLQKAGTIYYKMLHFSVPAITNLLRTRKNLILEMTKKLFGNSNDISFEISFFRVNPGRNSIHWHDDYTLFFNKLSEQNVADRLLLNFHIALTDVSSTSSPLSFLKGTEKMVYARSAIKYFKDENINFDEDTFLKATFLTENIYKLGEEVKENFTGMLPSISYRIHQSKNFNKKLEAFYKDVKAGQVQIFSPHLLHTSPFINRDKCARESLVLRFLAGSCYNYRNVVTVKDLINNLSLAKTRKVSLFEVKNCFFKDFNELSYDSKVYFNVYIDKPKIMDHSECLKIYLDDLNNFFGSPG